MNKLKTINAKINYTMLGYEGHGILTFNIGLDFEGNHHQGFGGYSLGGYDDKYGYQTGSKFGMDCVAHILRAVGVHYWEDLKGKPVRIRKDGGQIVAIGHYLNDKWFNLIEFAKESNEKKKAEGKE